MVIKDWKRVGEDEWENIKINRRIRIEKVMYLGQKNYKEFGVYKDKIIQHDTFDFDYFKTKSQALKFAKSYMRTH